MHQIKEIYNKEMARVFRDKKMVFTVFILPVLMVYLMMTLVGNLTEDMTEDIANYKSRIYLINAPADFGEYLDTAGVKYRATPLDASDADGMKAAERKIRDGKAELIVEFPADFKALVDHYQVGSEIPQIKTYYNPSEDYSSEAYSTISAKALEGYRQQLLGQRMGDPAKAAVFTVNSDNPDMVIQDDDKASGKAAATMLPYFITILLFAGAMSIGTDMVAGEKERGTMASLLVAPIRRSSIALGKVFALMTISGLSALIYVVAMVVFARQFTGGLMGSGTEALRLSGGQIAMLAALLIAIAFLYTSLIVLFSVFAKTVKEASSYVMPAYVLIVAIGLISMFVRQNAGIRNFLIPIYNNTLALQQILTQEITGMQFAATMAETLLVGIICQIMIVRAFNSEKIMSA